MPKTNKINIKNIDLIVYDFDGVLTDNKVLVFTDGQEAVYCNRSDGMAIGIIKNRGVRQLILSTEENGVVAARAKKLNIEVLQGLKDKRSALKDFCRTHKYNLKKVVYIGNDINDLDAMSIVGYPVAPSDANVRIKTLALIVVKAKGGDGVVRELLENYLEF